VGFAPDGTLFVSANKGGGTAALYTYDLAAKKMSDQPVLSVKGFDANASLDIADGKLIGIHYQSDAQSTYWLDPRYKEIQAKVDKLLPRTANILGVPYRTEVPMVLVHAFSDRDPGEYFVYDTKSEKLVRIARTKPDVDPAQMATRELVRYKARDGMEIPAWLTKPRGAKGPLPMIVWVHGGPYLRGGTWAWSPESQFFASRGYAVLEPEFRGSKGFGMSHFRAGLKQWGLAMQDDIADGARWAAATGIADPKRICIGGGSYGGYATLMGLAKDPDLYKCGVAYAAVTDLDLMYTASWSDASEEYRNFGMPRLIGDRVKDAERLKATSPITVAGKIRQPLLIGHGAQDVRVPIQHGRSFESEVEKSNPNVEWVVYPEEGHGLYLLKDRLDFYGRVEKFLARNIGDK
jgi:dipeptidyl aminopeptidase/acylaminoacyl peptidase